MNARLTPALIATIAIAAFLPALQAGFVWDDHQQLAARSFAESFTRPVWQDDSGQSLRLYRPAQMLWYTALRRTFGLSPLAFHLGSVLLHAICSLLVWRVARDSVDERVAAIVAVFFAVHPIHVESVAWVAGVTDLLCALFFLAAFLAVLRGRWVLATLLFLPSVATKEVALVFPIVVAADAWIHGRRKSVWPAILSTAIAGVLFLWIRNAIAGSAAPKAGLELLPLFATYVRLVVWPHPLSAFYAMPQAPAYLGALAAASILAIGWRFRATRFGLAWFVLTLAPPLFAWALLPAPIADRYLYLPLFGALLALAPLLRYRGAPVCAGILIAACFVSTWQRTNVWRDDITLWTDTAAKSPSIARVHYNLGTAHLAEKHWNEAAAAFDRTLALQPRHVEAHFNLALALHALGDDERAREHLRAFVGLYPHNDTRRQRAVRLLSH